MPVESTMQLLDYFNETAIRRYPGVSEALIAEAMGPLAVTFPPTLQAFLRMTNGLLAIDYRFFGVEQPSPPGDLVTETRQWREETAKHTSLSTFRHTSTYHELKKYIGGEFFDLYLPDKIIKKDDRIDPIIARCHEIIIEKEKEWGII